MSEQESHNIYNLPDDQVKMPEDGFSTGERSAKRSLIPILLGTILLLLVILGGLVYWGWDILFPKPDNQDLIDTTVTENPVANPEPSSARPVIENDTATMLNTSDELGAIQVDLVNTDLNNLDPEMSELEATFSN